MKALLSWLKALWLDMLKPPETSKKLEYWATK